MTRFYVGFPRDGTNWEVFSAAETPTERTAGGRYWACVGPFRTKRGAFFMATFGRNNPHCLTVNDAEKLAREGGAV